MSNPISVEPQKTALLLMDFQEFALKNFLTGTVAADVVEHASRLLAAARTAGVFVVHVTVNFRRGYPEISPRNKLFCWLRDSGLIEPGSNGTAINAALLPTEQEPVIAKHRIGAFMGTDLDRLLRARGIETLICAGATTSGAVLSTVRQAFDLDYELIVVRDGCADTDNEVHDFLIDKIISHHAAITRTDDIEQVLNQPD
ncbi:cysteine hydrolase [Ralstonia solanacearum]|uniref:cysteine hydrolase family protein n=1 Tax=Ralstonia solanacearum TaxID=305 RepID=UPI001144FCB3|nr:isochorismatase family cysteine hydrolase [Ralstonia solanacearum]MBT1538657.1 cysteine hydrolase [Ralstonia solanacearum]